MSPQNQPVEEKVDLILGLAPLGTLKGDRSKEIKNLIISERQAAKREAYKSVAEKITHSLQKDSEGIALQNDYNTGLFEALAGVMNLNDLIF